MSHARKSVLWEKTESPRLHCETRITGATGFSGFVLMSHIVSGLPFVWLDHSSEMVA